MTNITGSVINLTDVTYGRSLPNATNYNFTLSCTNTGLQWTNLNYSGALTGDAYENNDPSNQIRWGASVPMGNFFFLME